MELEQILNHFDRVKRLKGNSYQARCPCHDDKKASLTVTAEGDKILMHCHAGCDTRDILAAVGLNMRDLSNKAQHIKEKAYTWREKMGVEAVYDYGSYVKVRCKCKVIRYGKIVNDNFIPGMPKDTEKTIYNLDELLKTIEKGFPVYFVEGEKDADNLRRIGLTATTAGGCGDWKSDFANYFAGARLVILPDNDKPGQELADRIEKDVENIAYSIKRVTVSDIEKGDVSDYLQAGGTRESLLELVNNTEPKYASWVKYDKAGKPNGINTDILAYTISKTLDYIIINKPGLDIADFHIFKDGAYRKCSKNEAKGYIQTYIPLGMATDSILNSIYGLLLCSREKTCSFASVNAEERFINIKNGIFDLSKHSLEKHTPEFLSTLQLNCNYNPNAKCPLWCKYIDDLCCDTEGNVDTEKINLLQEWTGLLLSNVNVSRTKKCLVLTSPLGNTGKSVYLNVLGYMLGIDNIINIPIQKMSDRFSLSDLCGRRADLVGDQTNEDIEDSSGFKQLTGGDSVKIEFKGKQSFSWHFSGGIVICCNDLPAFTDDKGGHIFERLQLIPCENVIPPDKRDGGLSHKLYKEADGIFRWALEGLYRLRDNKFKFSRCSSGERVLVRYRERLDTLFGFLEENYEITGESSHRVKKTDFETEYTKWCEDNEMKPLKKSNVKDRAAKNGIELVKVHGTFYYKGIKPIFFRAEDDNSVPDVFKQQ